MNYSIFLEDRKTQLFQVAQIYDSLSLSSYCPQLHGELRNC